MTCLVIKIFLRSLLLQSLWNYERMQNIGFVFSIIPWLRKLYKNNEKFYQRVRSHLGFFNTHPYFANLIIGIVMKLEEKYASNEIKEEEITVTKTMLSGPLAAIGDRLVWSTWRVFCGIIGVSYFVLHGKNFYTVVSFIPGVLVFLLLYNLVCHLPIRMLGIYLGYNYSKEVVEKIAKFSLQKIVNIVRNIGVIILCITAFVYSTSLIDDIKLTILFWINILTTLYLYNKVYEIVIFFVLLFFDILVLSIIL